MNYADNDNYLANHGAYYRRLFAFVGPAAVEADEAEQAGNERDCQ